MTYGSNVARTLRLFSLFLIGIGFMIGIYPMISVARLSDQVLGELPDVSGIETVDTHHRLTSLVDDDFIVSERRYEGMSGDALLEAFGEDGFERTTALGLRWMYRECCGAYDAMLVGIQEVDGSAVALVTMTDDDVQAIWLPLLVVGLLLIGSGIALNRRTARKPQKANDVSETQIANPASL